MYGFGAVPHLPNYNVNETEQWYPIQIIKFSINR